MEKHIVLHEHVDDMKSLIQSMDLVVTAAGSTLYEVCACGVPIVTYSIADNQILGGEAFEKYGLGLNVGDLRKKVFTESTDKDEKLREDAVETLMKAVKKLRENLDQRVKIGIKMQQMIDGYGADRMVAKISNLT